MNATHQALALMYLIFPVGVLVALMVIGALWASWRRVMNERGVVLVIVLLIMPIMLIMTTSFLHLALTEHKIAHNYTNHTQAFYTAEGGLETARQQLKVTADWTTLLGTTVDCSAGLPGTCSYTIDQAEAERAVITATAQYRNARRVQRAQYIKTELPIPPGGITSIGAPGSVGFNGNAFEIDGNNWVPPQNGNPEYQDNAAAACTTPVPKLGIAVQDVPAQIEVLVGLTAQQESNILGAGGTPSVGVDDTITHDQILELAAALESLAGYTYAPGAQVSNGVIGTQNSPVVAVAEGDLTLSATSGAGVLIVKNGVLKLSGSTQWVGLILLVGDNAKLETAGGGDKSVYGSVIIAETSGASAEIASGGGNFKVKFSCDGLNVADLASSGRIAKLAWWTEVF